MRHAEIAPPVITEYPNNKTEAAHFAQPAWGASPIVMTGTDVNDDWGSIYQGVMPNDGVLVVSFTGTNESSYAAGPGAQSLVPWANGGGKFSMPVTRVVMSALAETMLRMSNYGFIR